MLFGLWIPNRMIKSPLVAVKKGAVWTQVVGVLGFPLSGGGGFVLAESTEQVPQRLAFVSKYA